MPPAPLFSAHILGLRVDSVTPADTLLRLQTWMTEKTHARHVVTADASMTVAAQNDADLHSIVQNADLVTPDGAGILWASRVLGLPIRAKVSGVDLVKDVCALSAQHGLRVFFLGAAPGVAQEAADNLRRQFPQTQIVGVHDGYFSPAEEADVLRELRAAKPDCVFVAFGIPKQEKWIAAHKHALPPAVWVGVGGSFDVYSGRVKRAPVWMQNAGLEWLHRLAANPKKIGKVLTLPTFAVRVLRQRWTRR